MRNRRAKAEAAAPFDSQPFLYEIRVKGRLSNERWSAWFDQGTLSAGKGETILRGQVPDHAALYGLLARLRDLAVPLVAVKVLDSEAQRRLRSQSRRLDLATQLLLIAAYLTLLGGLSAITVFVAPAINVALALALLFALLGGLAYVARVWSGQAPWGWVTYGMWVCSAVSFLVFVPVSGLMPTALSLAFVLFIAAGGLIYIAYAVRRWAGEARERLLPVARPRGDAPSSVAGAERRRLTPIRRRASDRPDLVSG